MTKVLYLGADEEWTFEDAAGEEQTVSQGSVTDVDAETLAKLKEQAPSKFWFGDEPEPEHREAGAEGIEIEDSAREEMAPAEPAAAE